MTVNALNIKEFDIKKMSRNSLIVENRRNGMQMYIHRRVFNTVMENPELPLFEVDREFMGCQTKWLATPMTF